MPTWNMTYDKEAMSAQGPLFWGALLERAQALKPGDYSAKPAPGSGATFHTYLDPSASVNDTTWPVAASANFSFSYLQAWIEGNFNSFAESVDGSGNVTFRDFAARYYEVADTVDYWSRASWLLYDSRTTLPSYMSTPVRRMRVELDIILGLNSVATLSGGYKLKVAGREGRLQGNFECCIDGNINVFTTKIYSDQYNYPTTKPHWISLEMQLLDSNDAVVATFHDLEITLTSTGNWDEFDIRVDLVGGGSRVSLYKHDAAFIDSVPGGPGGTAVATTSLTRSGNTVVGNWPAAGAPYFNPQDGDMTYRTSPTRAINTQNGNVYSWNGATWSYYSTDIRDASHDWVYPGRAMEGDAIGYWLFQQAHDMLNFMTKVKRDPYLFSVSGLSGSSIWTPDGQNVDIAYASASHSTYATAQADLAALWPATPSYVVALDPLAAPRAYYKAEYDIGTASYKCWAYRQRRKLGAGWPWAFGGIVEFYAKLIAPAFSFDWSDNGSSGVPGNQDKFIKIDTKTLATSPLATVLSDFFGGGNEGTLPSPPGTSPSTVTAKKTDKGWAAGTFTSQGFLIFDFAVAGGFTYK